jgi:hypothetical protein
MVKNITDLYLPGQTGHTFTLTSSLNRDLNVSDYDADTFTCTDVSMQSNISVFH